MEEETMKMRKLLPFVATTAIAASMFGFAANAEDFNLTVNLASEPQTMDPQMNTTLDGGTMLQHLFEGLMNGKPQEKNRKVLTEHVIHPELPMDRQKAMTEKKMKMVR